MRRAIAVFSILIGLIGADASRCRGEEVAVSEKNCVIVLPAQADAVKQKAAADLQKHLKLITGAEVEVTEGGAGSAGKYTFLIGQPAPQDSKPLAPEEARWVVTPQATYLYGHDDKASGSQFAVYGFLEEQLGVRWIAPGDSGIAYQQQSPLKLTIGESSWAPELTLRKIRTSWRVGKHLGKNTPEEYARRVKEIGVAARFLLSPEETDTYARDVLEWQDRMRMGAHSPPHYGHAFTTWWDTYGKSHPEYFGLNQWGYRGPEPVTKPETDDPQAIEFSARDREYVKLCPSNPQVAQQIVQDWVKSGGMKRTKWINVCENDQLRGFCRCENCTALDVLLPGEKLGDHQTDRYVHLANAVAREARKIDEGAWAVMYGYNASELPPRREKLEPNVLVAFVPTTVDLKKLEELYGGWEAAGAKALFLRPNYHTYYNTCVIPTGFEKHMYDAFQVGYRHGAVGTDYDSLMGHWAVTGLCEYVLAHAFADPKKPYEHWEEQYYSAYGPAAPEVKQYFRYWRTQVWDQRLAPDLNQIIETGRWFNFARGLMMSLERYYRLADFDHTDALLAAAAKKDLSPSQRADLNDLIFANQHARLTFETVLAKGPQKTDQARKLLTFREEHKGTRAVNFLAAFYLENRAGNLTGMKALADESP